MMIWHAILATCTHHLAKNRKPINYREIKLEQKKKKKIGTNGVNFYVKLCFQIIYKRTYELY